MYFKTKPLSFMLQNWLSISSRQALSKQFDTIVKWLKKQSFIAEFKTLFGQKQSTHSFIHLKTCLILLVSVFVGLSMLDILKLATNRPSTSGMFELAAIVLALSGLLIYSHFQNNATNKISLIAKASFIILLITGLLLLENNPTADAKTWIGLLPLYFFTFGQLFMSVATSIWLNLSALILIPPIGYLVGIESQALLPSIILLLIINTYGFCSRRQLEAHTRSIFQQRSKAEKAAHDKAEFLRQLSHNLRQPLQALSCYSSVLDAAYIDKPSDPMQAIVGKLGMAIDELNNTFNRILDIANLETAHQIPLLASVDINVLLARLEDQFAPQAAKRGLKLIVRLRDRPPYSVHSDASMLSQIVGNFIDNAIKYTANGWILVETVKISSHSLKLHIIDTGIGITEQQLPHIFDEFYRGHRRTQDIKAQGLGIGLAYVSKAVQHLPGHTVRVHSKPNQGSNFEITLPLAYEPPYCKWLSNPVTSELNGYFVFLVDDDQDVLDALSERLISWGCLVQKARSKTETMTALIDTIRPPDILISDYYLQDNETAHDIIAAIEANYGSVPILILSAHAIPTEIVITQRIF